MKHLLRLGKGGPGGRGSRGGGRPTLSVLGFEPGASHLLVETLRRHGWRVREPAAAGCDGLAPPLTTDVAVVLLEPRTADCWLSCVERHRVQGGGGEIVFLDGGASEAHHRWAVQLSPYLYPATQSPETTALALGSLLMRRHVAKDRTDAERRVTIRLWESLEINGRQVYLGAAERNFLFLLASKEGQRIAKSSPVDAGGGRSVVASCCRRRLGQRLSPELAELLIPVERGEPYRFREPADVAAACAAAPDRHVLTRLQVVGRAEVLLVSGGLLETVA